MPEDYDDPFLRPGFDPDDARPDFDARPPAPAPVPAPAPAPPSGEDTPTTDDFVDDGPIIEEGGSTNSSLFTVEESSLSTKTYQYGGAGANCRSQSSDWAHMPDAKYWSEGAISGDMRDSQLTIESRLTTDNAWITELPDEYFTAVVAEDSYVELSVRLTASDHYLASGELSNLPDFVKSFSVCLEAGDSISATVGGALYNFSLVKGGVECINSGMVADLNSVFTSFAVEVTIKKAVYCSYESDAPPIQDVGGGDGTYEGSDTSEWSQTDSWVLLGVITLILLITFVRSSLTGGGDSE